MSAHLEKREGGYSLVGEVTVDTVPDLWREIEPIARSSGEIEVSCAEVGKADSSAVACLLEWMRVAHQHQGQLRITDLPHVLEVIIDVSDLRGVLILADKRAVQ